MDADLVPAEWNEDEMEKALAEVARLASHDKEFRELALTNATAALREVTESSLPEGFKLRFVENEGANLTIVLPDPLPEDELSEEDLDVVAGGFAVPDWAVPAAPETPAAPAGGGDIRARIRSRIRQRIRERSFMDEGIEL